MISFLVISGLVGCVIGYWWERIIAIGKRPEETATAEAVKQE
jgi:hypothetical protein